MKKAAKILKLDLYSRKNNVIINDYNTYILKKGMIFNYG